MELIFWLKILDGDGIQIFQMMQMYQKVKLYLENDFLEKIKEFQNRIKNIY